MPIKRTVAVLALLALPPLACQRGAAPLTDEDRNAMRTRVADLDKAMLAADWSGAAAIYTEDGMVLPPNAPAAQGRAAIEKLFSGFPKASAFQQRVEEIEGHGDLAYIRATYDVTIMPSPGRAPIKDRGKVLAVWRKQADGSWLVTRAAWNSDQGGSDNSRPATVTR
jgi:uncharacterized protein (TIGR02246 family)